MNQQLIGTVVLAAVWMGAASQARAQAVDSAPRFSVFGGTASRDVGEIRGGVLGSYEFGGSGDFRLSGFPLPVRATLAFGTEHNDWAVTPARVGTFSLDAIARPLPRLFGLQPYLLGGLGVATRAEFTSFTYVAGPNGMTTASLFAVPRQTWAFAEGGVGLEFGRHLFVQTKMMTPVASQGPTRTPVSIGFRF